MAGLDSWSFPTSVQLVHLKRPCDKNSMLQEIDCSCSSVVCFSFKVLLFFPFFIKTIAASDRIQAKLWMRWRFRASLSDHLPFPHLEISVGFSRNVSVSRCRGNQEFRNHKPIALEVDDSLAVNQWGLSLIFRAVWSSRVWLMLLTHFLVSPIISHQTTGSRLVYVKEFFHFYIFL